MQISDESLMALADGELDQQTARQLRDAVAADPELSARYRRFVRTRQVMAETARAGAPPTPADDPLAAMIRAASTRPQPAAAPTEPAQPAPQAANLNRRPLLAAAASLAIAAVGLGWWGLSTPAPDSLPAFELAALDGLPSGESQVLEGGVTLTMIASYQAAQGGLCREYETARDQDIRTVLACRDNGAWGEQFAQTAARAEGYQPASGDGSIDATLERIGAGTPLTPEQEAAALGIDPPG